MKDAQFQKTTLSSGLRVLTERHLGAHSCTLGLWVAAGSVYEGKRERGLAHLLEHLVFKGTHNRSMTEIARVMDDLGGQMNAFTEREFVCYHTRVLSSDMPLALELMCDLVTHPRLDADDLELERGVVLEEIKGVEDVPEEWIEELFTETIWERSEWGRSILGTAQSVKKLSSDDLRAFMRRHYTPGNCVLVAVGDVDHAQVVAQAEAALRDLSEGATQNPSPKEPIVTAHHVQVSRETEQVHFCVGTQAYSFDDPRRFSAWALDSIMTGGYSSRLYQEVREKRGLCYHIGGVSMCHRRAGLWAVETSVAPRDARKTAELIGRELRRVKDKGVSREELERAHRMSRVNILLAEENPSSRMGRIARNELYHGRQKDTDEVLHEVLSVTQDDVLRVAQEMFSADKMNFAAIGPFKQKDAPLVVDVG